MKEIIEQLGFRKDGNGKYFHKLLERSFDLSACSTEGIIYIVFNEGVEVGELSAQVKIREAIGIE